MQIDLKEFLAALRDQRGTLMTLDDTPREVFVASGGDALAVLSPEQSAVIYAAGDQLETVVRFYPVEGLIEVSQWWDQKMDHRLNLMFKAADPAFYRERFGRVVPEESPWHVGLIEDDDQELRREWQQEVAAGDTVRGFEDWKAARAEQREFALCPRCGRRGAVQALRDAYQILVAPASGPMDWNPKEPHFETYDDVRWNCGECGADMKPDEILAANPGLKL